MHVPHFFMPDAEDWLQDDGTLTEIVPAMDKTAET
jgi:hypothetical protein